MWTSTHVKGLFLILLGVFILGCVYLYEFDGCRVRDDGKGVVVAAMLLADIGILAMAIGWLPKKARKGQEPPKSPSQQQSKPAS